MFEHTVVIKQKVINFIVQNGSSDNTFICHSVMDVP